MNFFSSDVLCPTNVQTMDWIRLLVFSPLLEECIFRLGVQHYWIHRREISTTRDAWRAVFVSAMLFSVMHASTGWIAVFAVFLPGLVLAILYQVYRSYLLCVLAHSFFNGALLLVCK
jgi:membrane protease YdiL (CAAX protease family)